jgi:hypothetical protein
MKATIISIESPDVEDLEAYQSSGPSFCVPLQLLIGPRDSMGEELFDLQVCSPDWLKQQALPMIGRHLLIVSTFDFHAIREFLEDEVDRIEGDTWNEVGEKLGRIGHWEFEDYHPDRA